MNTKGFTLVEVQVAALLAAVVVTVIALIFFEGLQTSGIIRADADVQHRVRKAVYQMASEIRNGRTARFLNPNQLTIEMPVFYTATAGCSAFVVSNNALNPIPCSTDSNCGGTCAGTCSKKTAVSPGICVKDYTYRQDANRIVATATGDSHVVANNIQTLTLSEPNPDVVLINATATKRADYEKRTEQIDFQTVVALRN